MEIAATSAGIISGPLPNPWRTVDKKLLYDSTHRLGRGPNSDVFHGSLDGYDVAVKRIELSDTYGTAIREEEAFNKLTHPNVVECFYIQDNPPFRFYALELCDASMDKLFLNEGDPRKYRGPMPSGKEVLWQIAKGLEHIHSKGFVHRHISPENILISVISSTTVLLKLSDFGLSKPTSVHGTFSISGFRGSLDWAAPEILEQLENLDSATGMHDRRRGSNRCDIFSAGCVVFYYVTNGNIHPFGDKRTIYRNILEGNPVNFKEIKSFPSGEALEPILECMIKNLPQERIELHVIINQFSSYASSPAPSFSQQGPLRSEAKKRSREHIIDAVSSKRPTVLSVQLKWNEEQQLGRGGYAVVYRGTFCGKDVAVKIIPTNCMRENSEREAELQRNLKHENVVELLSVEQDAFNKYIVLELCSASLERCCLPDDHPKRYNGPMPSDPVVLLHIAQGMKYLQEQKLVHRDIKPENILISMSQPVRMKLSDFGLCKRTEDSGMYTTSGVKGTIYWQAPELIPDFSYLTITGKETGQVKVSFRSDIFSAGCVFFFYLKRGIHPFGTLHYVTANIFQDNPTHLKKDKKLQPWLKEMIGEMIAHNPEERISLEDIIKKMQSASREEIALYT